MSTEVVNSSSKYWQKKQVLKEMTERAMGKTVECFTVTELAGGMCNAVYLVEADGRKMVLKIAPSPSVTLMRHEYDSLLTEAKMLKIFEEKIQIPAPKMTYLDTTKEICDADYFFMSFVEGESLLTIEPKPEDRYIGECKREVGVITRKICSIQADCFGVPALKETYRENNCDFMLCLFQMLIEDATDRNVSIPAILPEELLSLIECQRAVLNEAEKPCYIHTDTWEGNLMMKDNRLEGLVDFAAILYGDPLMSHDFHDFSPEPRKEFLEGYGKTRFTRNERIRITIYKMWQRLGMIVERGYREYEDENQYAWVLGEFEKAVEELKELIGDE